MSKVSLDRTNYHMARSHDPRPFICYASQAKVCHLMIGTELWTSTPTRHWMLSILLDLIFIATYIVGLVFMEFVFCGLIFTTDADNICINFQWNNLCWVLCSCSKELVLFHHTYCVIVYNLAHCSHNAFVTPWISSGHPAIIIFVRACSSGSSWIVNWSYFFLSIDVDMVDCNVLQNIWCILR